MRILAGVVMSCIALATSVHGAMPLKTTIKGLHTDGWSSSDVAGNETGWVAVGFEWATLVGDEPSASHYSHIDDGQCARDGNIPFTVGNVTECFRTAVLQGIDAMVSDYRAKGVRMVGIIIRVPKFARIEDSLCQVDLPVEQRVAGDPGLIWCAPSRSATETQDIRGVPGTTWLEIASRFLAHRYGEMIGGWVVMNEVNAAGYFRTGCLDCTDTTRWLDLYAATYNSAYDGVRQGYLDVATGPSGSAAQRLDGAGARISPMPAVLAPMAGFYDTPWDTQRHQGNVRTISVKTFLRGLHQRAEGRNWRVAAHAYPRDLRVPLISADDLTRSKRFEHEEGYADNGSGSAVRGAISPATIGAMVGFLRSEFCPGGTCSPVDVWRVYMTEGGINTLKPGWVATEYPQLVNVDFEALQQDVLCDAFRNYLGTPGIDAVLLHRMIDNDNPEEHDLRLGLRTAGPGARFKPAWGTFALANRYRSEGVPVSPFCGFENLPYTRIQRANSGSGHRISSRVAPAGANVEVTWYLFREERPGSRMLYECWIGSSGSGRTFATAQANCDSRPTASTTLNLGPIGFAYAPDGPPPSDPQNWELLYSCKLGGSDDIVTGSATCEGWGAGAGTALGWARKSTTNADDTRYVRLRSASRAGSPATGGLLHWATTVLPPPGFTEESVQWWILREPAEGATLYYECEYLGHSFPSERADCEGQTSRGPLGYIAQLPHPGGTSVALYRCSYDNGFDHKVTDDANCGTWARQPEFRLGYTSPRP